MRADSRSLVVGDGDDVLSAQQAIYTHTKKGMWGHGGWQFVAFSTGVRPDQLEYLERLAVKEEVTDREGAEWFPSFHGYPLNEDTYVFGRTIYTGATADTPPRRGNQLTHNLLFSMAALEEFDVGPSELFAAHIPWVDEWSGEPGELEDSKISLSAHPDRSAKEEWDCAATSFSREDLKSWLAGIYEQGQRSAPLLVRGPPTLVKSTIRRILLHAKPSWSRSMAFTQFEKPRDAHRWFLAGTSRMTDPAGVSGLTLEVPTTCSSTAERWAARWMAAEPGQLVTPIFERGKRSHFGLRATAPVAPVVETSSKAALADVVQSFERSIVATHQQVPIEQAIQLIQSTAQLHLTMRDVSSIGLSSASFGLALLGVKDFGDDPIEGIDRTGDMGLDELLESLYLVENALAMVINRRSTRAIDYIRLAQKWWDVWDFEHPLHRAAYKVSTSRLRYRVRTAPVLSAAFLWFAFGTRNGALMLTLTRREMGPRWRTFVFLGARWIAATWSRKQALSRASDLQVLFGPTIEASDSEALSILSLGWWFFYPNIRKFRRWVRSITRDGGPQP